MKTLHHQELELTQAPGDFQVADADSRKRLEKIFVKLRKQEALRPELLDALTDEIEKLM